MTSRNSPFQHVRKSCIYSDSSESSESSESRGASASVSKLLSYWRDYRRKIYFLLRALFICDHRGSTLVYHRHHHHHHHIIISLSSNHHHLIITSSPPARLYSYVIERLRGWSATVYTVYRRALCTLSTVYTSSLSSFGQTF